MATGQACRWEGVSRREQGPPVSGVHLRDAVLSDWAAARIGGYISNQVTSRCRVDGTARRKLRTGLC